MFYLMTHLTHFIYGYVAVWIEDGEQSWYTRLSIYCCSPIVNRTILDLKLSLYFIVQLVFPINNQK